MTQVTFSSGVSQITRWGPRAAGADGGLAEGGHAEVDHRRPAGLFRVELGECRRRPRG
ncbi:hypothetical protein [Streptomyces sp. NPDC127108]|uniref:hypothetical protein n=1 Tax=Streptomyces sp. NPDC127108 TaxID=3345361 RepID=UPI003632B041